MQLYGYSIVTTDPDTKLSGGGIVLISLQFEKRGIKREYGHAFSSCEASVANLKNMTVLLNCTMPAYRSTKLTIYTDNDDIHNLINQDTTDAAETRKWLAYYKSSSIIKADHLNPNYIRAKELAKIAAATQKNYDSGNKSYNE